MQKIASPQQLQTEIRRIMALAGGSSPSREVLARELRELANRLEGRFMEAAIPEGPKWLKRMLQRQRNVTYDKGTYRIPVGEREADANRLEDKINAEANRMKSIDEEAGYDVEAWGTQDPKTGEYTVNIQV